MAANPNTVSQVKLTGERQTPKILESKPEAKPVSAGQRIRRLLIKIFEVHVDFVGRTPE
jgi:hypothetical protein